MTQAELAKKVGRTDEAISNIERGKNIPSLETLMTISGALNLPIRDFFPSGTAEAERRDVPLHMKEGGLRASISPV